MNWMDLLRMSGSNLKRRKLRTFLTVLGVVIGTASIVVMISLGLGMQQSLYREVEQSGGLTTITVTGKEAGETMMGVYSGEESAKESTQYVTDQTVKSLAGLEHVEAAAPVYDMSVILLKGKYEGYIQLTGMTPEGLKAKNIELGEGSLPGQKGGELNILYGNAVITNFSVRNSEGSYWETGELPDIDLMKDSMFLILDQEGYHNSQQQVFGNAAGGGEESPGANGSESRQQPVKKHAVKASGLIAGGPEDYNADSYSAYCDLDTLKRILKKDFAGRAIPGQPTTKSGKPYKEFCYTSVQVKVEDIDSVDAVSSVIREMGYNTQTNAEYLDSMKSQFAIVQAVLGGIGAVSLLVAAIGIANTMMMSIYERTKEIGVIKVLGCSLKNIKQMFLIEAAFIGLIGGIVGNILSFLMSAVINFLTRSGETLGISGNVSYIPWWLVLLSMGFAVFVGVAAGYFPSLRAMRLSPIEAIRTE